VISAFPANTFNLSENSIWLKTKRNLTILALLEKHDTSYTEVHSRFNSSKILNNTTFYSFVYQVAGIGSIKSDEQVFSMSFNGFYTDVE